MPTTWVTKAIFCAPVILAFVFLLRSHLVAKRVEYWTLAEGTDQPTDKGAVMRILFVGNSFIHYNGGAEKVQSFVFLQQPTSYTSSAQCPWNDVLSIARGKQQNLLVNWIAFWVSTAVFHSLSRLASQVVARLLEEHLGAKVYARRYAPGTKLIVLSSY